jgi:hypothetical protein
MDETHKLDIAIPEEAAGRGILVSGTLRSDELCLTEVLAQFSRISTQSHAGKIYLYTNAPQAKLLYGAGQGPYSFEGMITDRDGRTTHYRANDIWLVSGHDLPRHDAVFWTHCSGRIGIFETVESPAPRFTNAEDNLKHWCWFRVEGGFLIHMVSGPTEEEIAEDPKASFYRPRVLLTLGNGATAELFHHDIERRSTFAKEMKRRGYSIRIENLADPLLAKGEADAIALLASFASRERCHCWHWNHVSSAGDFVRRWRFDLGKSPRRGDNEEPLLPRDRSLCAAFLSTAMDRYRNALHKDLLSSAISALLLQNLPLELRIARYVSGLQGALLFGLQKIRGEDRPELGPLFREFTRQRPRDFSDLWPLVSCSKGSSLLNIRNAIVHGEAFSEEDFLPLSIAAENLQWYLERVILLSLGWDIEHSDVSPGALSRYVAYNWRDEQSKFKI